MPFAGGKIAFVAEAPGSEELRQGEPLVGPSGHEFNSMLRDASILRSECLITNVFPFQLPGNEIKYLCGKKAEMPKDYLHGPIAPSCYLYPQHLDHLERLRDEIEMCDPNIIVPMGNTALWAIMGRTGIGKARGTVMDSTLCPGRKVIPMYHPAAIMRNYELRPTTLVDLMKIKSQSEFPEIRRPQRELWLEPNLGDIWDFHHDFIRGAKDPIAVDIETKKGYIECVGFAPSPERAIVIPFVDQRKPTYSYWSTTQEELEAWTYVKETLEGPLPKSFQNGLYDIQWLARKMSIKTQNAVEDTMILHHALQPEMRKGLDFLGSIYTDEIAWKGMKPRGHKMEKRDE
jgi:DNA polymerase